MDDLDKGNLLNTMPALPRQTTSHTRLRDAFRLGLFILLVAFPLRSDARVFFRWRTGSSIREAFDMMNARSAYRGKLLINGGKGDVEVFTCPYGIRETAGMMRRHIGEEAAAETGGSMVFGKATEGGAHFRFVAVQLSAIAETTVFVIAQDEDPGPPVPITRIVPSVPSYPGSEPVLLIADPDRQTSLGNASTADSPEAVRGYYADTLAADGWEPATGVKIAPDRPGMTVFIRGAEILCCQAERDTSGATRITLLHKRQGLN